MPRLSPEGQRPDWNGLYELAAAQGGYFTLADAAGAGFSAPLLHYHARIGRIERTGRAIFRLVNFPVTDEEDLVPVWLWSERRGVFSHETALALHGLSDALSSRLHLTLPAAWSKRRLRVPDGVAPPLRRHPETRDDVEGPGPRDQPAAHGPRLRGGRRAPRHRPPGDQPGRPTRTVHARRGPRHVRQSRTSWTFVATRAPKRSSTLRSGGSGPPHERAPFPSTASGSSWCSIASWPASSRLSATGPSPRVGSRWSSGSHEREPPTTASIRRGTGCIRGARTLPRSSTPTPCRDRGRTRG